MPSLVLSADYGAYTLETATLDDFMALNDQLAALAEAGLPLSLGLDGDGDHATASLERINADVARRVSRGATLAEALDDADRVPASYRCLMQIGLRSGQLDAALDGSQRLADAAEQSRYGLRAAFFYPLVVCGLAYLGLIGLCLWFEPTLEAVHEEFRLEWGSGLRVLHALRVAMPFWVPLPPLALLAWLAWRRFGKAASTTSVAPGGLLSRLTGATRAIEKQRWANFADSLAMLVTAQTPLAEALRMAACASGDADVSGAARALADSLDDKRPPAANQAASGTIPPFLRWALLDSEPAVDRARALRMAADIYRDSSVRGAERARLLAPILACIVIGGGAALLYGLALFVPVVQLLKSVAAPTSIG
jgi:type II secretory pathway component PulF